MALTSSRIALLVLVAACGGGTARPDASDRLTCGPNGPVGDYYVIPPIAECEYVDCRGITCDTTCETGTICGTLDCTGSSQCRLDCQPGATCTAVTCDDAGVCFIDCHGEGSTCEVSCLRTGSCDVNCPGGAQCLVDCGTGANAAQKCVFDTCGGTGMIDCGNGVFACNRACP